MAFTYDNTTALGQVRLLASDTISPGTFDDSEVQVFLNAEDLDIKRAAALACETIAGSEALAQAYIKTTGLSTDCSKTCTMLFQRADRLRQQAKDGEDAQDEDEMFGLVSIGENRRHNGERGFDCEFRAFETGYPITLGGG